MIVFEILIYDLMWMLSNVRRRVYESENIVVARESELFQIERGSAKENANEQLQFLQKNVSTAEDWHNEVRRSLVVQHYRNDIHNQKVDEQPRVLAT